MQFHGGKSQTHKQIAAHIDRLAMQGSTVWEPFMGGAWVTSSISHRPLLASDANEYTIAFWKALVGGWVPPSSVTEAEYRYTKTNPDEDKKLTGFIGTALSFGGKWWGGFARPNKAHPAGYAPGQVRSCLKKRPGLAGVEFHYGDYHTIQPTPGDLVYCDPPYFNTSNGYKKSGFDPGEFWAWVVDLSLQGVTVLISEVSAPIDIEILDTFPVLRKSKNIKGKGEIKVEHLYILRPATN